MKTSISIKNIASEFSKLKDSLKNELLTKSELSTSALLSDLKEATPVDTGFAKASWSKTKSSKGHIIENTAEYIQHLNQGTSKQAPAHFIESIALRYGRPVGTIIEVKT